MIRNKVKAKLRFHITLIWVGSLRVCFEVGGGGGGGCKITPPPLSSVFSFCKIKGYSEWKYRFYRYASGIRLPHCSKLTVNWKNGNDIIIFRHDVNVVLFLLTSIATGPGFMLISSLVVKLWQFLFIKDWPEIQKSKITPSVWLNIWRLLRASNTKFGANVSNKMLLNDAKCQGYSFYRFWAIKEKPTGRGGGGGADTNPHAPRLKVNADAGWY